MVLPVRLAAPYLKGALGVTADSTYRCAADPGWAYGSTPPSAVHKRRPCARTVDTVEPHRGHGELGQSQVTDNPVAHVEGAGRVGQVLYERARSGRTSRCAAVLVDGRGQHVGVLAYGREPGAGGLFRDGTPHAGGGRLSQGRACSAVSHLDYQWRQWMASVAVRAEHRVPRWSAQWVDGLYLRVQLDGTLAELAPHRLNLSGGSVRIRNVPTRSTPPVGVSFAAARTPLRRRDACRDERAGAVRPDPARGTPRRGRTGSGRPAVR